MRVVKDGGTMQVGLDELLSFSSFAYEGNYDPKVWC